jgi:hypothetical protein
MNPRLHWARTRAACVAAALVTLLAPALARAQSISFLYVAPKAPLQAAFGTVPPADTGYFATGYADVRITAANEAKFRTAAPANLVQTFDALKAGTALRRRVDQILQISGGITDETIALVDDRAGVTNARFATSRLPNGTLFVWPAAGVGPKQANGRHRGFIGLGTVAANKISTTWPGAWKAWEGTIMHECSHTQFVNEKTKWGAVNIVYGGDNKHYLSEILGEQELTFEEGLGTFYGLIDNPDWPTSQVLPFFQDDTERYSIESWSVLAGTAEVWNAPHSESRQTPPTPPPTPGGQYAVRTYKWKDVPGFYILFNENTSTGFHYFFWKNATANRDSALAMVLRGSSSMSQDRRKRNLAYAVNRLSLQLEDYAATPAGVAAKQAGTLTSSMYPFALLDVLTHFGMSEATYKREHVTNHPDRNPKAFADYWTRRAAVRQLVQADLDASPIRIEHAVQAVRDYFRSANTILATGP